MISSPNMKETEIISQQEKKEISLKAKVLILGLFDKEEIISITTDKRKIPNLELDKNSKEKWQEILISNPRAFIGKLYKVCNWDLNNGKIILELGETDYREYVGSRDVSDLRNYGFEYLSNPLGVSTVLITKDNKLIISKKLSGDATGSIDTIGGFVSPEEDTVNGKVDIFHTAVREIAEELNFQNVNQINSHLSNMTCIGLAYEYSSFCHINAMFAANIDLDASEIEPRISYEIKPIAVNLNKQSPTLEETLKSFYPNIEPDGRVVMALVKEFTKRKNSGDNFYPKRLLRTRLEV